MVGRNGDGRGKVGVEASGRKFEGRRGDGVRGYHAQRSRSGSLAVMYLCVSSCLYCLFHIT